MSELFDRKRDEFRTRLNVRIESHTGPQVLNAALEAGEGDEVLPVDRINTLRFQTSGTGIKEHQSVDARISANSVAGEVLLCLG